MIYIYNGIELSQCCFSFWIGCWWDLNRIFIQKMGDFEIVHYHVGLPDIFGPCNWEICKILGTSWKACSEYLNWLVRLYIDLNPFCGESTEVVTMDYHQNVDLFQWKSFEIHIRGDESPKFQVSKCHRKSSLPQRNGTIPGLCEYTVAFIIVANAAVLLGPIGRDEWAAASHWFLTYNTRNWSYSDERFRNGKYHIIYIIIHKAYAWKF